MYISAKQHIVLVARNSEADSSLKFPNNTIHPLKMDSRRNVLKKGLQHYSERRPQHAGKTIKNPNIRIFRILHANQEMNCRESVPSTSPTFESCISNGLAVFVPNKEASKCAVVPLCLVRGFLDRLSRDFLLNHLIHSCFGN
jgi:hypothetical protein